MVSSEPCQAQPALPPASSETFNRLGTDEYFNVVVDLCSYDQTVAIEERDLLERSYEDYLEGSESVIVKSRLRVNVDFGKALVLPSLSSALLRKVIRYRFTILLRQLFFIIRSLPYRILILFSVQLPNFLKLVRLWSVLFRRWLLISCQFIFNPTGRKGLYKILDTLIFLSRSLD